MNSYNKKMNRIRILRNNADAIIFITAVAVGFAGAAAGLYGRLDN